MKRKTVLRLLCISMVSAMLITTPCMVFAHEKEERKTAIYNGERIEVIIDGDYVILPDEERILLEEFTGEFIETKADPPVGEEMPKQPSAGEETPESPEQPAVGEETPKQPPAGEETPEQSPSEEQQPEEPPSEDGTVSEEEQFPGEKEEDTGKGDALPLEKETTDKKEEDRVSSKEEEKDTEDQFHEPPSVTAGIGFYVEELAEKYHLTFKEEFKDTVSEIEEEFLAEVKHTSLEEVKKERVSKFTKNLLNPDEQSVDKEDRTVFTNWQDVLAVYLLEESKKGADTYVMDAADKDGIAAVFRRMNAGTVTENEVLITAKTVDDYKSEKKGLNESDYAFLEKYTSSNCSLLCASATGIQGFIAGSLGGGVSPERAQVVEAAYSLVGKIPYYYGGKSSVIGWDLNWGKPELVTASGILRPGAVKNSGLDCSGFVTWAFINGYEDKRMAGVIGHGTSSQWWSSVSISEEEAKPGDLVFLDGPQATGPNNHVGIVAGRNDDGKLVAIHCNGSDNGVVVESAYEAGFRYVRRPAIFAD